MDHILEFTGIFRDGKYIFFSIQITDNFSLFTYFYFFRVEKVNNYMTTLLFGI